MGVLTREMLEFGIVDANSLIKSVVAIGPLEQLKTLREHYLYNINPWGPSISTGPDTENVDKQIKLYSKEKLVLDISVLKKQYTKLKQRQRQAHIIFNAAVTRHPPRVAPIAMNHLLLGKSALVPARRLGPPKGAIPPARQPSTLQWKDTPKSPSSSSSSDTELCDDPNKSSSEDEAEHIQLRHDNLDKISDKFQDNTSSADLETSSATLENYENLLDFNAPLENVAESPENFAEIESPCENLPIDVVQQSDIFDSASGGSDFAFNKFSVDRSDSIESDEAIDFENFLEERIRCLKKSSLDDTETSEDSKRIKFVRKNSERALKIIQENSLILHRILQCQNKNVPFQDDDNSCQTVPVDNENVISESPGMSTSSENITRSSTPNMLEIFRPHTETGDSYASAFVTKFEPHEHNENEKENNLEITYPGNDEKNKINFIVSESEINKLNETQEGSRFEEDPLMKNTEMKIKIDWDNDCNKLSETDDLLSDGSEEIKDILMKNYFAVPEINDSTKEYSIQNSITNEITFSKEHLESIEKKHYRSEKVNSPIAVLTSYDVHKEIPDLRKDFHKYDERELNISNAIKPENMDRHDLMLDSNIGNTNQDFSTLNERKGGEFIQKNLIIKDDNCKVILETKLKDSNEEIQKELHHCFEETAELLVKDEQLQSAKETLKSNDLMQENLLLLQSTRNYPEVRSVSTNREETEAISTKLLDKHSKSSESIPNSEKVVLTDVQQKLLTLQFNIKEAGNYLEQYRHKHVQRSLDMETEQIQRISKYKDILDYSKDLDDRYNNLILNRNKSCSPHIETTYELPKSELDTLRSLEDKPSSDPFPSNTRLENDNLTENTIRVKSPNTLAGESSTLRSPNRIYNPFPVNISSRQNKDVAVKLGLYKK